MYMLSITIRFVMIELLLYFIMQVLSCKTHIVIFLCFARVHLFMMFNMKSIAIAFPQHTNYGGIHFINVFYQVTDEERAVM